MQLSYKISIGKYRFFTLVVVFLFSFSSCKEFYSYQITNSGLNKKKHQIVDKNYKLRYEFSGKYTWIAGNFLYSAVRIKIDNESENHLIFNSDSVKFVSKNYNYKLSSASYQIDIRPGKSESFVLEYIAEISSTTSKEIPKMPVNEEADLLVEGLKMSDETIVIETIHFLPE